MLRTSLSLGELPANGYIRQAQLIPTIVPFSPATLWRKVKAGEFPKPVKLSDRVTAWRVEDVRQWMDGRPFAVGSAVTKVKMTKIQSDIAVQEDAIALQGLSPILGMGGS